MESLEDRQLVAANGLEGDRFDHDIEAITEQIWHKLDRAASREEIREMVTRAASAYEDVRVRTFVPIFLHRDVIQRLRDGLDRQQSVSVPEARDTSVKSPSAAGQDTIEWGEPFEKLELRLSVSDS